VTDKISTEEEDDWGSPPDTCFQCLVSETAAEARGYQRAIDTLRDQDAVRAWFGWVEAANLVNHPDLFADFLESRKAKS
jgi:hypothetical protein